MSQKGRPRYKDWDKFIPELGMTAREFVESQWRHMSDVEIARRLCSVGFETKEDSLKHFRRGMGIVKDAVTKQPPRWTRPRRTTPVPPPDRVAVSILALSPAERNSAYAAALESMDARRAADVDRMASEVTRVWSDCSILEACDLLANVGTVLENWHARRKTLTITVGSATA